MYGLLCKESVVGRVLLDLGSGVSSVLIGWPSSLVGHGETLTDGNTTAEPLVNEVQWFSFS